MSIFKGYKDNISWRKIMTCGALIAFMSSVMGFLITHNFNELPVSYQAIIAGVFVFYFGKDFVRGVKVTSTENEDNK